MCECQRKDMIIDALINDIKELSSKNAELTIRLKILEMENRYLKSLSDNIGEHCKEQQ
ncbi:hypothetical protein [Caloramator sp. E03]|uniref:hypothetical protein n=1 Tax=Caloramator sp. E03 TaxID=2576307 RepID=UPI00143D1F67|nr:hypothetical protein [Caloramator sp. E03]